MPRILVLGGRGFFGAAAVELLREAGETPLVGSRQPGAECRIDAEDPELLHSVLRPGDIVIDAAGPFQERSTALVECALEVGCDVIDLADSFDFVAAVRRLEPLIAQRGTRVLTACSSVSAVTAALVRLLGVEAPRRVAAFLAPATRNTSTAATARSLMATLGRPVRVVRDGKLVERRAFSEERTFAFPAPLGVVHGRLGESADALTLPLIWPSLEEVGFWVDTRRRVLNTVLAVAARSAFARGLITRLQTVGRRTAKRFGAASGGFGVEVEDGRGFCQASGFLHSSRSYLVAVAPAVLAARAIKTGTFGPTGLLPADRYVDPHQLVELLCQHGIEFFQRRS